VSGSGRGAAEAAGFHAVEVEHGELLRLDPGPARGHATALWGLAEARLLSPSAPAPGAPATFYGMVLAGEAVLETATRRPLALGPAMHFVAPEPFALRGAEGTRALVIAHAGAPGLFQLGGPIEPRGRLRYIDGCTDTLVAAPPRLGDACLNHLHLPPDTDQRAHVHPSDRLGAIVRGSGVCVSGEARHPLRPGLAWWIPPGCRHAFRTGGEALDVLAWHPDSDFGPTDDDHPMINRTLVGG
jgi:quercetin dioxygenase-like cupin family protein